MNETLKKICSYIVAFFSGVFAVGVFAIWRRNNSNTGRMGAVETELDRVTDNQCKQSEIVGQLQDSGRRAEEVIADTQSIIERVEARNKKQSH